MLMGTSLAGGLAATDATASRVGSGMGSRLALERRSLREGIKKAGGPIWPTAQRLSWRLYRLGLPLGGRRSPAHGEAAARESGPGRCLGDDCARTHLVMRLPFRQTGGMIRSRRDPVNDRESMRPEPGSPAGRRCARRC